MSTLLAGEVAWAASQPATPPAYTANRQGVGGGGDAGAASSVPKRGQWGSCLCKDCPHPRGRPRHRAAVCLSGRGTSLSSSVKTSCGKCSPASQRLCPSRLGGEAGRAAVACVGGRSLDPTPRRRCCPARPPADTAVGRRHQQHLSERMAEPEGDSGPSPTLCQGGEERTEVQSTRDELQERC